MTHQNKAATREEVLEVSNLFVDKCHHRRARGGLAAVPHYVAWVALLQELCKEAGILPPSKAGDGCIGSGTEVLRLLAAGIDPDRIIASVKLLEAGLDA